MMRGDTRAKKSSIEGRPLSGIVVLELGHIVAGPTAGQILADLGADVLKIEAIIGGDQSRGIANGAMFHFFNRNKRSVALNLKKGGRDVFLKLAASADVIIDNFAYGSMESLQVGYDTIASTNPGVVWLSIKGFLPGPAERRPLLDELAQMMGGLSFMTGPRGQPMRAGASVIDVGAATYGVIGVLAALRQRDTSGRGQLITAGLYETSVYWVGQWMAVAQESNSESVPMPEIQQGQRMGWGVYQLFNTLDDDQIFIGITSNQHWERFCTEFNLQELYANPRFASNQARVGARSELALKIGELIKRLNSEEVQRRLERAVVPFAPLRRPDQLIDELQLRQTGQLMESERPGRSTLSLPKLPISSTQIEMSLREVAPVLGSHTVEVLRSVGYSPAEIDQMLQDGDVGQAG